MTKQRVLQVISLFLLMISIFPLLIGCSVFNADNGQPTPTDTPSVNVENSVTLSYTFPVIPVTLTIDSSGHISVALGVKITTLIGEFEVSASSAITVKPVPANSLLLVIRHYEGSRLVDSVFRIDVGKGAGTADIKAHISEVKIAWNGKVNNIFVDASNGDITSIMIRGAATTPTTVALTPTITPSPTSTPPQETLTVGFMKNTTCSYMNIYTGVKTAHSYQGSITLTISGTGKAIGNQLSDAFYIFTDEQQKPNSPIHNDTTGAILFINNQPADKFIHGSIPPYNPNHTYTFTIMAPGGQLIFSVGDCKSSNNQGQYNITIS